MKPVKVIVDQIYYKSTGYLKNNSSLILSTLATVGVIGTAVIVAKATPKAIKLLEDAEAEKGEKLTVIEKVVVAGPSYIPAVAVGTSTAICIFSASALNEHQQTALSSAYTLILNTFNNYRNKAKEIYGADADIRIRDAMIDDRKRDYSGYVPGLGSLSLDGDKELFYDEYGQRFFEATSSEVYNAEYHLNRNFTLRGYADINEFYDFLALDKTDYGDAVGWNHDYFYESGMMPWIDFHHRMGTTSDGVHYTAIEYVYEPVVDYCEED